MMKVSIHQEDITILNIYIPNRKTSKIHKAKLIELQRKIGKFTVIVGNFKTPLSLIAGTSRQKTNYKDAEDLNHTINQVDLMDVYSPATMAKYTFFFKCTRNIYQNRPYSGS